MSGAITEAGERVRASLMNYLRTHQAREGFLPGIYEMGRELDMRPTSVKWHLQKLRDKGLVDYRDGKMSRSLRLL